MVNPQPAVSSQSRIAEGKQRMTNTQVLKLSHITQYN